MEYDVTLVTLEADLPAGSRGGKQAVYTNIFGVPTDQLRLHEPSEPEIAIFNAELQETMAELQKNEQQRSCLLTRQVRAPTIPRFVSFVCLLATCGAQEVYTTMHIYHGQKARALRAKAMAAEAELEKAKSSLGRLRKLEEAEEQRSDDLIRVKFLKLQTWARQQKEGEERSMDGECEVRQPSYRPAICHV